MANALPDVPFKDPVLNSGGFLAPVWAAWFREAFNRMGKSIAPTNAELGTAITDDIDQLQTDVSMIQSELNTAEAKIVVLEGGLNQGRQL